MRPHHYEPDFNLPLDPRKIARLCKCGLPKRNRYHDETAILEAVAEERREEDQRRTGDR